MGNFIGFVASTFYVLGGGSINVHVACNHIVFVFLGEVDEIDGEAADADDKVAVLIGVVFGFDHALACDAVGLECLAAVCAKGAEGCGKLFYREGRA